MPVYTQIQDSTSIATGPYSELPPPVAGYTARELTTGEEEVFASRETVPYVQMVLADPDCRIATYLEQSQRTENLKQAIEIILYSVTDPSKSARVWFIRAAIDNAYNQNAPQAIIKSMIESVDLGDDAELESKQTEILELPQWSL